MNAQLEAIGVSKTVYGYLYPEVEEVMARTFRDPRLIEIQRRGYTRRQDAMGPMMTGQFWQQDPWGNGAERYSSTPAVIWVDRYGRQLTSDDPSFDPRTPYDQDWRRVR